MQAHHESVIMETAVHAMQTLGKSVAETEVHVHKADPPKECIANTEVNTIHTVKAVPPRQCI